MMEMFLYFSTVLVVLLPYCVVHVPFSFEFVGKEEEREALVASKEEEEEKIEPAKHPVVKVASKVFNVYKRNVTDNFLIYHKLTFANMSRIIGFFRIF